MYGDGGVWWCACIVMVVCMYGGGDGDGVCACWRCGCVQVMVVGGSMYVNVCACVHV